MAMVNRRRNTKAKWDRISLRQQGVKKTTGRGRKVKENKSGMGVQKMRKVCETSLRLWRLKRKIQSSSPENLWEETERVVLHPPLTTVDKVPLSKA